ncbi:uncharacterized protein LOC144192892 isoform X2 [Stigmatopora nigra]
MVKGTRKFNKSLSKQVALMDKTGYDILPESGQRKYGVPPPGPAPRFEECQVFVGNIPRDMYEIELVPLFKTAGTIYELWLTVEFSGENRRNAYVTYTKKEEATLAVDMFDHYEVRQRRFLAVCLTVNNCHLLAENIPTEKTREEGNKVTETLQDVTAYPSTTGEKTALSNKELLVEEPIPLKRTKRKEQLPIKEVEEITRSSIEPLSSQDGLSEGSRGTDLLSSSSSTEQLESPSTSSFGTPEMNFTTKLDTFLRDHQVTVGGKVPKSLDSAAYSQTEKRQLVFHWRKEQVKMRIDAALAHFPHILPNEANVQKWLNWQGWKNDGPTANEVIQAWKPSGSFEDIPPSAPIQRPVRSYKLKELRVRVERCRQRNGKTAGLGSSNSHNPEVEEPIPLKRQKRKEQLPIKEAEEITRSSIEPLSSQDVLSEGSRGTDPLSSSSPTEQFGSTPKWKVKKKVQMLRMGLYRKHSLGHPLLKGFFNYLSKDLSIENCNQEVENVARFLYYMDPTRPSLLFVRDREKVQEYLRKLSEANLTKRTQLNYLKNLKRFLLYQTNNTNLYMKDKPLCIDAKMYVDFIGCLQKQLNKGVSKEIIAVREKFLQENMGLTPYQCNAVLRAAQSDFVAIIKKILDSAPTYAVQLKMSDLVLVLYYLEAIVILKHLQRPGVVQHMTIEEWKNRVRLERDHTAIGVKDHKTAAQQLAAFVLSPEEEAVC